MHFAELGIDLLCSWQEGATSAFSFGQIRDAHTCTLVTPPIGLDGAPE
jgi:hypothetical protein